MCKMIRLNFHGHFLKISSGNCVVWKHTHKIIKIHQKNDVFNCFEVSGSQK